MAREHEVDELAKFLAEQTRLATIAPSQAGVIAERLIEAGWRRPSDTWEPGRPDTTGGAPA